MKNFIRNKILALINWATQKESSSSYMIYMGRDIYKPDGVKYVTDLDLEFFLNEQPYFDSFTIWSAKGSWRGNIEDTIVIEVFDTDLHSLKHILEKMI